MFKVPGSSIGYVVLRACFITGQPGTRNFKHRTRNSYPLLRLSLRDRLLEKCPAPFPKMFQSLLLLGIQFRFNFSQGSIHRVADLLHRLNLNRLHLFDRSFNPGTELFGLFWSQVSCTRQSLHQSVRPVVGIVLHTWQPLSAHQRMSDQRPGNTAR